MRNGQSSLLHYMEMRERENNLGLVRFIVACLVMYFHAYYLTGNAHNYELLRVMIFFIISGFFVYGSFSRNLNAFRFIFARAIRIFPGLIGVVLFTTFIVGPWMTSLSLNDYLHSGETWQYLRTIMIYPLPPGLPGVFESNPYSHEVNGSLWTLQLEMVYYASLLILFFVGGLKRTRLLVLFLIVNLIHFFPMSFGTTYIELYRYFLIGMLLYAWRHVIPIRHRYALIFIVILWVFKESAMFYHLFLLVGAYLVLYAVYKWKLPTSFQVILGNLSYGMFLYGYRFNKWSRIIARVRMLFLISFSPYRLLFCVHGYLGA